VDKVKKSKTAIGRFLEQIPDYPTEKIQYKSDNILTGKKQAESLVFELPSGKRVRFVAKLLDTKKCRVWSGNLRLQDFINEENLKDLKNSIKLQGQVVPVLVRPIKDSSFTHEIIYGSRRFAACKSLGMEIKALEADINNDDAIMFMEAENAGRKSISAYETALAYKQWLDAGMYKSQKELSEKLGITREWLNKILSLNKIPRKIIESLSGPLNLSLKDGCRLVKTLSESDDAVEKTIKIAENRKKEGVPPELILKEILGNSVLPKNKLDSEHVIKNPRGKEACRITRTSNKKLKLTVKDKSLEGMVDVLIKDIEGLIQGYLSENPGKKEVS